MSKKMLIDATHAEETRVAVVDGHRLVEFDYESKVRKQLRSSIFLAKVTRVEPSLQAAFVNYGGNRHGFLPFSEIHPDYFRIPIADREALLAAQAAELEQHDEEFDEDEEEDLTVDAASDETEDEEEDDDEEEDFVEEVGGSDKPIDDEADEAAHEGVADVEAAQIDDDFAEDIAEETSADENDALDGDDEQDADVSASGDDDSEDDAEAGNDEEDEDSGEGRNDRGRGRGRNNRGRGRGRNGHGHGHNRGRRAAMDSRKVDMVGGDGIEGDRPFRFNMRNRYKIQEVIKRGQIMLIQVNKEERGNKGAAVSTYLSLPGRYCVLMPNSPRGGGVSRKIANYADRKRMREILKELEVPEGMSVILRTAGVARTSADIKRDLDYLTRLWNQIREDTLNSSAPALIYEEGNLIKRSIRDLYTKDIDDIVVSGSEGYKTARDFMKMLIPSHLKRVSEYKDERIPLFHKYRVEPQIAEIGKMTVTLKSGGYLVINPTEALVSVDVNSGKSTKERHIEETALKTNLEAAEEVARQLRLRDLGGLVVIDFIDMEDRRNNRRVEQRLKDALSSDRARIQVGRISSFGLMELSRQRLNPSLTEMQFERCPHCDGIGFVPSLDFSAIAAMRALEEEGIKDRASELSLSVPSEVGLYILNHKREMMNAIERRYGFKVHIRFDDALSKSTHILEILQKSSQVERDEDDDADETEQPQSVREENDGEGDGRSRRRRGRRGGRNRTRGDEQSESDEAQQDDAVVEAQDDEASGDTVNDNDGEERNDGERRSRRGRRGGRNRNRNRRDQQDGPSSEVEASNDDTQPSPTPEKNEAPVLKAVRASNDRSKAEEAPAPRDYETVNPEPTQKKRGWWNKLVE